LRIRVGAGLETAVPVSVQFTNHDGTQNRVTPGAGARIGMAVAIWCAYADMTISQSEEVRHDRTNEP